MIEYALKTIVTSLFVAIAWPLLCLEALAWQSETPVEYVVEAPKPQRELATVSYRPSDAEKPFFQKLGRTEIETGGLAGDYDIRNHDAQYVGWFGIVRNITVDIERHETRLLIEHKYFDGLTDAHLQALSFNGSGDFEAILSGDEHQIEELQLVKVYGTVTDKKSDKLPSLKVDFALDWAWGTFTFIMAHGTQRGNEEWRKLNTIPLDDIYSSRPDEKYYIARLGPNKAIGIRTKFDSLARGAAMEMGFDQRLLRDKSGSFEKLISNEEFRARSSKSALKLQPESKSYVAKIQDAIVDADYAALREEVEAAMNANMQDALASVLAHALVLDDDDDTAATSELKELGGSLGKCVPELIEALRCDDDWSRNFAAELLGEVGSDAELAIPALIQLLSDPDSFVRGNGAEALGNVKRKPELVVPALVLALKDSDAHVRYSSAGAIEMFGHDAREAATELAQVLMEDIDIKVRWNTAGALGATGNSLIAVPALVRALTDSSPAVNRFAAMGLKQLGKDATDAIPKLKEQLNARDEGARIASAEAIFHIEGNVDDGLPILQSIVIQGKFPSAMWAANALVAFGPKAKPALKSLVQATRSGQIYVQTSSIRAIGSIGIEAVEALPRLRELMKEKNGEIRARSATAIWKICNEHDATLELIQDLEIDEGQLSYTIEAIGEIGSLAKEAIPILQKQLTNQDQFVRNAAKDALDRIVGEK